MDGNGFQELQVWATHFINEIINMQVWVLIPTCITDGYASYILQYWKQGTLLLSRKLIYTYLLYLFSAWYHIITQLNLWSKNAAQVKGYNIWKIYWRFLSS